MAPIREHLKHGNVAGAATKVKDDEVLGMDQLLQQGLAARLHVVQKSGDWLVQQCATGQLQIRQPRGFHSVDPLSTLEGRWNSDHHPLHRCGVVFQSSVVQELQDLATNFSRRPKSFRGTVIRLLNADVVLAFVKEVLILT